MKKTIYNIAVLAIAGFAGLVTSCSNDFDFDEARRENPEYAFKENFEKAFGTIDPNQSWDFTRGVYTHKTRAEYEPTVTTGEYFVVEKNTTLKWLQDHLKEGKDNRSLGKPFTLTMPDNSFTIVPIYQGQASMAWDLHMVVGTGADAKDLKIWSKSQGIQTSNNGTNWTNLSSGGNTLEAKNLRALQYTVDNIPVGTDIYFYLEITTGGTNYATKGTKQSSLAGMMLALQNVTRPSNLAADKEILIMGCEDANLSGSDWDMNDVVFLIYGNPEAPHPLEITNGEQTKTETISKRYMVEDLGATTESDIDFNDLVVDVEEVRTITTIMEMTNGKLDKQGTKDISAKQTITIRALGGTKDIALYIGGQANPIFRKSTESDNLNADYRENNIVTGALTSLTTDYMYNTGFYKATPNYNGIIAQYEVDVEYDLETHTEVYKVKKEEDKDITEQNVTIIDSYTKKTGYWEPSQNNIKVVVADDSQFLSNFTPNDGTNQVTEGIKVIEFPENGTVPTMIAVDPEQKWNNERVSVFPKTTDGKFVQGCELNFQHLKNN